MCFCWLKSITPVRWKKSVLLKGLFLYNYKCKMNNKYLELDCVGRKRKETQLCYREIFWIFFPNYCNNNYSSNVSFFRKKLHTWTETWCEVLVQVWLRSSWKPLKWVTAQTFWRPAESLLVDPAPYPERHEDVKSEHWMINSLWRREKKTALFLWGRSASDASDSGSRKWLKLSV